MAVITNSLHNLEIVSYNMHGFYQGQTVVSDMISSNNVDVFLLQEHWLTPSNLSLFDTNFPGYFSYGSSAMSKHLESGMLRGRPFGGVMILIKNALRTLTETIYCEERFAVVRIANYLIVNVYLPCVGSNDRNLIYEDVLYTVSSWRDRFADCEFILAGDFNINLDTTNDRTAAIVNNFTQSVCLYRCDDLFPDQKTPTYINLALGHENQIDYIFTSDPSSISDFQVLDPNVNFSDHVPIRIVINTGNTLKTFDTLSNRNDFTISQLRWDKGDRVSYYYHTGQKLLPLVDVLDNMLLACDSGVVPPDNVYGCIDAVYASIVSTLRSVAGTYIPKCRKGFFKFWWNEDLSLHKQASVDSDRLWKATGKPRSGPIFAHRQSCRSKYRHRLRQMQNMSANVYSNSLHDALLMKDGVSFWRCWRSKFDNKSKCTQVDGCVDPNVIADKFSSFFRNTFTCNDPCRAETLKNEFTKLYPSYCGLPVKDEHQFDTELVSKIIGKLEHGKAQDIDDLCTEHLYYCHPVISIILVKFFQLICLTSYIPTGFRYNYIVPIPKPKEYHSKSLTCNDFRGIAISPILSKIFEHCILDRFGSFFVTSDNQFGFKKELGCNYAIRSARNIVDSCIKGGSTVNLCTIDLSKAFDKINHHALFLKLMKRLIPKQLLNLLVSWLSGCYSYVKWYHSWSHMFKVDFGVRQGSVLSPYLFAIYMDNLAKLGQYNRGMFIILYADDILLLAPTIRELQHLLQICESELISLDMTINVKKSCCIRIGPRNRAACAPIRCSSGVSLPWVDELRYLGIFITRSRVFKISLDHAKKSFYRSANAIFGKVGRVANEDVVLQLLSSKCMPSLLYGLEACPLIKSDLSSLDFVINRFFMKLFKTSNIDVIKSCQQYFNFEMPSSLWTKRCASFGNKFSSSENVFCKITQYLV